MKYVAPLLLLATLLLAPYSQALECATEESLKEAFENLRARHVENPSEIEKKGYQRFKEQISSCPELANLISPSGNNLFLLASYHGDIEAMIRLASITKKPLRKNRSLKNALFLATKKDKTETLDFLWNRYSKKIKLEARDVNGDTALTYSAFSGSVKSSLWLLEKGAQIDSYDYEGFNVLLSAILTKNPVSHFFPYIKNFNHTNNSGWSALISSVFFDHREAFDFLIQREDVNLDLQITDSNNKGYTAFLVSIAADIYYSKKLYEKGANINLRSKTQDTALLLAMAQGKEAHVKWLIDDVKVDLNEFNTLTGETPLMRAILKKNLLWAQILLDHKEIDTSRERRNGDNACFLAHLIYLSEGDSRFLDEFKSRSFDLKSCTK